MNKANLRGLVEEIFNNLLDSMNTNKDISKAHVITYLNGAVDMLLDLSDHGSEDLGGDSGAATSSYKDIVKASLMSYKKTNATFDELTRMHDKNIKEHATETIDIATLTSKFNEIQAQMTEEISKANKTISSLTTRVKLLQETANMDSLTRVFNRRALDLFLHSTVTNTNMVNNMHLLMIDIDDFKKINDTHGHVTGDKVLIFVANILKKTLRDGDKIFRYGGEEFVVILNRNSDSECESVANRLLKLISSSNLIYLGEKLSVTVSIGITKMLEGDLAELMLSRADKALYVSKFNGKNQASRMYE